MSTVRYPLLDVCKWDTSRNPLLANLSSPLFSYISLLAASWSVIAAYCSLLATMLMVLLASRSSTYAAPGILLLIACSEDICYSPFAPRCLLYASPNMLLTTCYSLLYLFAVCSPITARFLPLAYWTPSFSLFAPHRSPHVCSMLTTRQSPLHAGSSRLIVRFFLFSTRRWQIVVLSS